MASGAPVVQIIRNMQPTTLFAPLAQRVGGSAPVEGQTVWNFDATTTWYTDFFCQLRGYAGGGLTFSLPWAAASATSGTVIWGIGIKRLLASSDDLDVSHTYDYNAASASTAPGTSGQIIVPTITFTNGADMDSWADDEFAVVRVRRDIADTATGNAQLLAISGVET